LRGVARVSYSAPLPPLQKNANPPTKLQSLKWKIGAKVWKKQKQNIFALCYFCYYSK